MPSLSRSSGTGRTAPHWTPKKPLSPSAGRNISHEVPPMLDRRSFLGTSLGAGLAVPLVGLGAREAEAATSLGQYVVLYGDGTGSAQSVTSGFRLRGGPSD